MGNKKIVGMDKEKKPIATSVGEEVARDPFASSEDDGSPSASEDSNDADPLLYHLVV